MLSHHHLLLRIISISITIVVIIITIVDVILQLGFASYSSDNQDARVVSWKAGGIEMEAIPIVAGAATSPGGERWTRVFKVLNKRVQVGWKKCSHRSRWCDVPWWGN